MSEILFIRHAQASFMKADYDQLSPLGEKQSEVLGQYWANQKLKVDRVYIGPLKRHRQTAEIVAQACRTNGLDWPEPIVLEEFREHKGPKVTRQAMTILPQLIGLDPKIEDLTKAASAADSQSGKLYLKLYERITRLWVQEKLEGLLEECPTWKDFRNKVNRGVELVKSNTGKGERVLVFSSGGPVAVAAGLPLDLSDEKVLELSWIVQNTSHSSFLSSGERFRMKNFNVISHLDREELITFI